MAATITKLKMEGRIDSFVADELLRNVPDSVASEREREERRGVEIERAELNQLMSLEMQLSPVQKRGHRNEHAGIHPSLASRLDPIPTMNAGLAHLNNLDKSGITTSVITPPLSTKQ